MSSSPQFVATSPLGSQPKSKFTYKQLNQLASFSTTTPLRTIAHIDLDGFYAQCEMVRLGVAEDQPLAVQQWQGLIAINYPARAFGLGRHITSVEAKKLCSDIVLQHVATWKEGDSEWRYHDDAFKNMATHKVSLDPYRRESKKIIACVKDALPASYQRVEKAGIDEMFLELSAQVHSILMDRYPELKEHAPDDPTALLPRPATTVINWHADNIIDLDTTESEEDDPDWDDIALSIAAEIVRDVRAAVRGKLKYTMSAGISRNKMLAKLGSATKKPNGQTVIRNRAIQQFLSSFKFTKIRNLGGKLGDDVVAAFNTDAVKDLLEVPLDQLQKFGDDTGMWLYNTIRGIDSSEVNPRTQIKSMLSAKSFRPSINTFEQALRWLRIFVADLYGRCVEEGVLEHRRKPKTINLHHRQSGQSRSKQAPIPQGKTITEEILFELAKHLMAQVVVDGRAWPCANLSLSLAGFEDGVTGNRGISGFLVRGEDAKALSRRVPAEDVGEPVEKRRKLQHGGIEQFLRYGDHRAGEDTVDDTQDELPPSNQEEPEFLVPLKSSTSLRATMSETIVCPQCHKSVQASDVTEHEDWHFANDLEEQWQRDNAPPARQSDSMHAETSSVVRSTVKKGRGRGRAASSSVSSSHSKLEKGQRRLAFEKG